MAEVHGQSPYTITPDGELGYPAMESVAFAAPNLEEENGWVDPPGLGYATPHRLPVDTTVRDDRTPPARPPDEYWGRGRGRETIERHGVEFQDADGFEVHREGSGKPAAPHASSIRPIPERLTDKLSPRSYTFTRPFDQGAERYFNGEHFSMADHRRNYDVEGYAPVRTARNTFRIPPTPWDSDIVDVPPDSEPTTVQARIRQVEIPVSQDRSYRLM